MTVTEERSEALSPLSLLAGTTTGAPGRKRAQRERMYRVAIIDHIASRRFSKFERCSSVVGGEPRPHFLFLVRDVANCQILFSGGYFRRDATFKANEEKRWEDNGFG
jgi:hypothetical protein